MKFERLIKLIRNEEVSFFIGAGFSLEAHAPSVSALKKAILEEISSDKRDEHKEDSLDELSEYYVEEECSGSRNSLIQLLKSKFSFTPACLNDHIALTRIPHIHKIYTTNYDILLEDTYKQEGIDYQVVRTDKDCTLINNKKPVTIFKIHGDFTDPDSLVITKQDYRDFFEHQRNKELWKLVESDFLTNHIVFIGYSLEDENILQIIKNVSEATGKNQKDMFLIAPGFDEDKKEMLKSMHVQYIDAYANEFLNEVNEELKKNISDDYRNHKISAETYSRFCQLYNITTTLEPHDDKRNEIISLTSADHTPLKKAMLVDIDEATKEKIEEMNFEKDGVSIPNAPYSDMRFLRIRSKNNHPISFVVNGVTIYRSTTEFLVGPKVKDLTLSTFIPSRNFFKVIHTKSYSLCKDKFVINFDGESYNAKFIVTVKRYVNGLKELHLQVTFTSKKFYHDNDLALQMINIPDALFSNEGVYFQELSTESINATGDNNEEIINNFHAVKRYYENVQRIEFLSREKFKRYEQYSDEALINSESIRSFLEDKFMQKNTPNGFEFSVKIGDDSIFAKDWDSNKKIPIVLSDDIPTELKLNGKTFIIPYVHDFFKSCTITVDKSTKPYIGHVKSDPWSYYQVFSDKPASELFPTFKLLNMN